jgi:ankyrin repeat protein
MSWFRASFLPRLLVLALSVPAAAVAAEDVALIEAVRSADIGRVRALLKEGVDVNGPQADGATALHWAAHRNDLEAAELLLRAGANASAANELGATPLWLASVNGSATMVERLLKARANPNAALASGETPLMAAARTGNANVVRLLVAGGADVNAKERFRGQTALMWAVEQGQTDVTRILLEVGANIHARSDVWYQLENTAGNANGAGDFEMAHGGSTPLLFAARTGDISTARVLLDAGANVNDTLPAGMSALVVAAHSAHGALVAYLLERGADPNAAAAGYTALHAAVLRGDFDLVKALLDHGADPNALVLHGTPGRRLGADFSLRHQMIGANAFWLAARFGEIRIMRLLVERGASPLAAPKDGTTALKAAMGFAGGLTENRQNRYGVPPLDPDEEERLTLEAARIAIEKGVNVNAATTAGDTALHDAVRQRFNRVIQFLVDHGANLNVKNKRNETPLSLALADRRDVGAGDLRYARRLSTAELLKKLGAREEPTASRSTSPPR